MVLLLILGGGTLQAAPITLQIKGRNIISDKDGERKSTNRPKRPRGNEKGLVNYAELASRVSSEDPDEARAASLEIDKLSDIEKERLVPYLFDQVVDDTPHSGHLPHLARQKLVPMGALIIPYIRGLIRDADPKVRKEAAGLLAAESTRSCVAINDLVDQFLAETDAYMVSAFAEAVRVVGINLYGRSCAASALPALREAQSAEHDDKFRHDTIGGVIYAIQGGR